MFREIITANTPTYSFRIPDEMLGKQIEIIAFELEGNAGQKIEECKKDSFEERTKGLLFNPGNYKFDRNDANNYE